LRTALVDAVSIGEPEPLLIAARICDVTTRNDIAIRAALTSKQKREMAKPSP
jgi:hypothetical protein